MIYKKKHAHEALRDHFMIERVRGKLKIMGGIGDHVLNSTRKPEGQNEKSGAMDDPHVVLTVRRYTRTKYYSIPLEVATVRNDKQSVIELDITTRRSSSLGVGANFTAFAVSTCSASRPRFGFEALVPRACAYAAW